MILDKFTEDILTEVDYSVLESSLKDKYKIKVLNRWLLKHLTGVYVVEGTKLADYL